MDDVGALLQQAQAGTLCLQQQLTTLHSCIMVDANDSDHEHHQQHIIHVYEQCVDVAEQLRQCSHNMYASFLVIKERDDDLRASRQKIKTFILDQAEFREELQHMYNEKMAHEEQQRRNMCEWMAAHKQGLMRDHLQAHVFGVWMRRCSQRLICRSVAAHTEEMNAQQTLLARFINQQRNHERRRLAFFRWQRRAHQRRMAALTSVLAQTQADAVVVRDQHVEELQMRLTSVTQQSYVEEMKFTSVMEENRRLRVALAASTSEFAEKSETFGRVRDENAMKENVLHRIIADLEHQLGEERASRQREREEWMKMQVQHQHHFCTRMEEFMLHHENKAVVVEESYAAQMQACRSNHDGMADEMRALARQVDCLAPLSVEVVRLDAQLAESAKSADDAAMRCVHAENRCEEMRSTVAEVRRRLSMERGRALLFRWMAWATHRRMLRRMDEAHAHEQHYLILQQRASQQHAEEMHHLRGEEADRLQRALDDHQRQHNQLRHTLMEVEHELQSVRASRDAVVEEHHHHQRQHHLDACVAALCAEELARRADLLHVEAQRVSDLRDVLHHRVCGEAERLSADLLHAMSVCDEWRQHCDGREVVMATRCAAMLGSFNATQLIRRTFHRWEMYHVRRRLGQQLRTTQREAHDAEEQHRVALTSSKDDLVRAQQVWRCQREELLHQHQHRCSALTTIMAHRHREEVRRLGARVVDYCASTHLLRWRVCVMMRRQRRREKQMDDERRLDARKHEWMEERMSLLLAWAAEHRSTWSLACAEMMSAQSSTAMALMHVEQQRLHDDLAASTTEVGQLTQQLRISAQWPVLWRWIYQRTLHVIHRVHAIVDEHYTAVWRCFDEALQHSVASAQDAEEGWKLLRTFVDEMHHVADEVRTSSQEDVLPSVSDARTYVVERLMMLASRFRGLLPPHTSLDRRWATAAVDELRCQLQQNEDEWRRIHPTTTTTSDEHTPVASSSSPRVVVDDECHALVHQVEHLLVLARVQLRQYAEALVGADQRHQESHERLMAELEQHKREAAAEVQRHRVCIDQLVAAASQREEDVMRSAAQHAESLQRERMMRCASMEVHQHKMMELVDLHQREMMELRTAKDDAQRHALEQQQQRLNLQHDDRHRARQWEIDQLKRELTHVRQRSAEDVAAVRQTLTDERVALEMMIVEHAKERDEWSCGAAQQVPSTTCDASSSSSSSRGLVFVQQAHLVGLYELRAASMEEKLAWVMHVFVHVAGHVCHRQRADHQRIMSATEVEKEQLETDQLRLTEQVAVLEEELRSLRVAPSPTPNVVEAPPTVSESSREPQKVAQALQHHPPASKLATEPLTPVRDHRSHRCASCVVLNKEHEPISSPPPTKQEQQQQQKPKHPSPHEQRQPHKHQHHPSAAPSSCAPADTMCAAQRSARRRASTPPRKMHDATTQSPPHGRRRAHSLGVAASFLRYSRRVSHQDDANANLIQHADAVATAVDLIMHQGDVLRQDVAQLLQQQDEVPVLHVKQTITQQQHRHSLSS